MIDASKTRKRQLALELQSSRVFEKRSNQQTHGNMESIHRFQSRGQQLYKLLGIKESFNK